MTAAEEDHKLRRRRGSRSPGAQIFESLARTLVVLLVWGVAQSLSSCKRSQQPPVFEQSESGTAVHTYGFVFHETTGITTNVLLDGEEVAIQFHPDSNPIALASLRALKWNVLYPNSKGERIFVTGRYSTETYRTPSCDGCPTSEEYHFFTLNDWYILVPFEEWQDKDGDPLGEIVTNQRQSLENGDFESFDGSDTVDIHRFQRSSR